MASTRLEVLVLAHAFNVLHSGASTVLRVYVAARPAIMQHQIEAPTLRKFANRRKA